MKFDEVIQLAREDFEPSGDDRERVRRRLLARAAGAGVAVSFAAKGSVGAAAGALGGQSLSALAKLFLTSMALTFVGGGAVVAVTRALSTPAHEVSPAKLVLAPPTAAQGEPAAPENVPVARAIAPPQEPVAPEAARRDVSGTLPAPIPGVPSASSSDLDAELALLKEARQAVAAGEPERARRVLSRLDEQHPHGLLMEERSALWALTACDAHEAGAGTQASEFLRRYPRSVYAPKVERSCGLGAKSGPAAARPPTASFTDGEESGH